RFEKINLVTDLIALGDRETTKLANRLSTLRKAADEPTHHTVGQQIAPIDPVGAVKEGELALRHRRNVQVLDGWFDGVLQLFQTEEVHRVNAVQGGADLAIDLDQLSRLVL